MRSVPGEPVDVGVRAWPVLSVLALLTLGVTVVMGAPAGADVPARLGIAVALQFLAAAAAYPALAQPRGVRIAAVVVAAVPIALAPLLVPAAAALARFVAAIVGGVLVMKLYDVHLAAGGARRPDLRRYLYFLPNPALVLRKLRLEPRPSTRRNVVRLAGSLVGAAGFLVAMGAVRRVDWAAQPFAVEHAVKASVLFAGFVVVFSALVHAGRAAGATTRDFSNAPWRARTPAEFWQRYNRCVGQFLYEDVFKPARRTRSAGVAVLLAFAVSGIIHEYLFASAIGRVQGYQLGFFMLQGVAVMATARLRPRGRAALPATAATLAFIIASSVPFFASFHGVVPIYARGLPPWLWAVA